MRAAQPAVRLGSPHGDAHAPERGLEFAVFHR
jgi:hypothetical protein